MSTREARLILAQTRAIFKAASAYPDLRAIFDAAQEIERIATGVEKRPGKDL
jgi:hypothetical protein